MLIVLVTGSLHAVGCGGSDRSGAPRPGVSSWSSLPSGPNLPEGTPENDVKLAPWASEPPVDPDDYEVLRFGHPPDVSEAQTIAALVRRYYAAAARGDGRRACALLFSVTAKSMAEEYGREGPFRGSTCSVVMSKYFTYAHDGLVKKSTSLTLVRIGVYRPNGRVVLRFANIKETRCLTLRWANGAWVIGEPMDTPLP